MLKISEICVEMQCNGAYFRNWHAMYHTEWAILGF